MLWSCSEWHLRRPMNRFDLSSLWMSAICTPLATQHLAPVFKPKGNVASRTAEDNRRISGDSFMRVAFCLVQSDAHFLLVYAFLGLLFRLKRARKRMPYDPSRLLRCIFTCFSFVLAASYLSPEGRRSSSKTLFFILFIYYYCYYFYFYYFFFFKFCRAKNTNQECNARRIGWISGYGSQEPKYQNWPEINVSMTNVKYELCLAHPALRFGYFI